MMLQRVRDRFGRWVMVHHCHIDGWVYPQPMLTRRGAEQRRVWFDMMFGGGGKGARFSYRVERR